VECGRFWFRIGFEGDRSNPTAMENWISGLQFPDVAIAECSTGYPFTKYYRVWKSSSLRSLNEARIVLLECNYWYINSRPYLLFLLNEVASGPRQDCGQNALFPFASGFATSSLANPGGNKTRNLCLREKRPYKPLVHWNLLQNSDRLGMLD
jgi:hypothetical protein